MASGILELALVIVIAAVLGIVAKLLRQPLILAYLLAGMLITYLGFLDLTNQETFRTLADLGIMFLLFLVGLEINYSSLRLVGWPSVVLGLGQIVFTFAFGYWIAQGLGFSVLSAAYISIALTFSSTIIVVKLLSEKRDLSSLYGKLSVGMLLVQDFVAILLLILLAGVEAGEGVQVIRIGITVVQGAVLFLLMLWLGRRVLPFVFDTVAKSQELLFIISLAWVFILAAAVNRLGFSIEIAGLMAGIALANSSEHFQIASRIRSLRDFFILIFFVILGASIFVSDFHGLSVPILLFSLFVLVGNPFIVLLLMGLMGYRKRTSFLTGLTSAQISEFSLILAALGFKLGHIPEQVVSLITAVGIITITLSSYLIIYADAIFRKFSRFLSFFERRRSREDGSGDKEYRKPIILVGAHRTGESIIQTLPAGDLLVIDFDPQVIQHLRLHNIDCIFGDISDPDIFERAHFDTARLVISTSPDLEDNLALLEALGKLGVRTKTVLRAETEEDAEALYNAGADYVLLPHFTSGQYLGKTIAVDPEARILENLKKRDLEMLRKRHRI